MARDLNALFKIANAINSQRDLESLQKGLLQLIFEVVPADAGAIQIIDNAEGQPNSTVTWRREHRDVPEVNVRHELVLRTLWERSEVVADLKVTSTDTEQILCVPLVALQKTIGVVYLVCYSPTNTFERDHVNFVSSVAAIAAVTLESVLSMESLRTENRQLREQLAADEPMIGESLPMRQLAETTEKIANGDAAVLIRGESGVGKEIVARAIHSKSARAAHPFIAINCAAIPDTLIESELFGYEKGAFTGAVVSKRGRMELAAGGTLFLDEIGELDPKLQAKLLRILQEKEFERVGGTTTIRFQARVLAATNKDLERAIENREFRQRPFLSPECSLGFRAAFARASSGHSAAGHPLCPQVFPAAVAPVQGYLAGSARLAGELQLARQRSRIGERHRACLDHGVVRFHPSQRFAGYFAE